MHDKQIRRRRAVLALLVVVSLILLTDYFGSPSSSPLHSVQRGLVQALAPVQEGASKVLSPFRDVGNWVSSTFRAKSEVASLQRQNHALINQLAHVQWDQHQFNVDQGLLKLDDQAGLASDHPVAADVIGKNPVYWYDTITIDQGTGARVALNDPVVGPGGLVGDISYVSSDQAIVTLLTSPKFSVGAMIENTTGTDGLIQPAVTDPASLRLTDLPSTAQVLAGQLVVTSGFVDATNSLVRSLYPAGIPIGVVSSASPQTSLLTSQQVEVKPLVDFSNLTTVQVLTTPHVSR
ncbi:MAG: rod shape-determining protein MreC [Solirubrobacteraceae bacterium]